MNLPHCIVAPYAEWIESVDRSWARLMALRWQNQTALESHEHDIPPGAFQFLQTEQERIAVRAYRRALRKKGQPSARACFLSRE